MFKSMARIFKVESRKDLYQLFKQFLKFGLVGLSNTAVSLGVYYFIIRINSDWYIIGNTVGWFMGVFNSFFWNSRFVFTDNKTTAPKLKLLKSMFAYGVTLLLTTMLLYFEINYWGISLELAPLVNIAISVPISYMLNKLWAFRS